MVAFITEKHAYIHTHAATGRGFLSESDENLISHYKAGYLVSPDGAIRKQYKGEEAASLLDDYAVYANKDSIAFKQDVAADFRGMSSNASSGTIKTTPAVTDTYKANRYEVEKQTPSNDTKALQTNLNNFSYTGKDNKPLNVDSAYGENTDFAFNNAWKNNEQVIKNNELAKARDKVAEAINNAYAPLMQMMINSFFQSLSHFVTAPFTQGSLGKRSVKPSLCKGRWHA